MNKISIYFRSILPLCIMMLAVPVCAQTKITLDKKPRFQAVKPTDQVATSTKYTEAELQHYQQYLSQAYNALLEDSLTTAAKEFQQATSLLPNHPSNAEVFFQLGQIAELRNDYQQAVEFYKKSTHINENLAKSYNRKAAAEVILGDYEAALRDYSRYIRLKPQDMDAYLYRGYTYQQLGRYGEAQLDYQKILDNNPFNGNASLAMATLDHKRGNTETAIQTMDLLINRFPENADYYVTRGEFEMSLQRMELASYDFDKAIELEPNNALNYLKRAAFHFKDSSPLLAQSDLEKASQLGATEADINAVILKANSDKKMRK